MVLLLAIEAAHNRVRATVAGDPPHTTVRAGPDTAVHLFGAKRVQRSSRLNNPR